MSKYLILIFEEEAGWVNASQELFDQTMAAHNIFAEQAGAALLGGEALHGTSTATSIRGDGGGGYTITDGPFAETKEALGGFYVIEAPDLDEAIRIAKLCPAGTGGVEVRPVMTF